MRVSFDRDLVGEAGEFTPLRDEALFRGAPKARQLLERGYLFRLRGFERGLDIDEALRVGLVGHRSEEHTSELQSLMRISYAVFCLKKKKKHTHVYYTTCDIKP